MSSRSALIALLALAPLAGCGSDADSRRGAPGGQAAAAVDESAPPRPDRPLPRDPRLLAERLRETRHSLHLAIDRWLAEGGPRERAPREVKLYALDHQRIYGLMTRRVRLARAVLDRVRGSVAAEARDVLEARRELSSLATPVPARRIRTGKARPAGVLLRFYRKAERRFEVPWKLLAAVNFVESAFGKVRNKSTAGAQGPMQFIPSTWEAYGMGGDVHDPHDAIMGAANYLHASGAPQNIRGALYAYNPSRAYVDAVLSYTRQIRRDRHTYYAFYSWQVFVRTPSGLVQLTGPGADR
jgi:soluble lytic murein transglycosylase-like protein